MDKKQARAILEAQRALVESLAQALTALESLVAASRRVIEEMNTATGALEQQAKLQSEQRKFAAISTAVKQTHEALKAVIPKIR